MKKMNKKGFTLIEMLVVIAIIAVLVSIIIPVVGNSTNKAEGATDAANLRSALAEIQINVMDGSIAKPATDDAAAWAAAKPGEGETSVLSATVQNMESKFSSTSSAPYSLYYIVMSDGSVNVCFATAAPATADAKVNDIAYYQTIAETGKVPGSDTE